MAALLVLSFFFSGHLAEKHGSSSCCEQWGCLLYVCTGPSMVIVVFDCLGNLGGRNQATGQVTSHLLLTPILIVLVTCHWVVLVACHWVVLVAYSHFWVLALFLKALVTCSPFWLLALFYYITLLVACSISYIYIALLVTCSISYIYIIAGRL